MNYNKVEFEAAFGTLKQIPQSDLPEIVFAGRSNVGKSSMLNRIFNRKNLARVSSMPGKTITINFFKVEDVRIVDLPGYGYAKVAKGEKRRWAEMMEGYFQSPRNIKLVVQLVDMRHKPSEDDYVMMRFLQDAGLPFIVAATKSDKLNKTQYNERKNALREELAEFGDNITILPFSSEKGEGTEELKEIIESVI
ncbi:MAG: ribosome biogenesis GTP-binding protein YihA/YsxC [Acutalibacteraceae bacterium]|nr:ribosome biogenesis GTP-binding protein YihA/YsxC [Acutalibacteraceae bacterium]